MSLVVVALLLPASPLPVLAPAALTETLAGAEAEAGTSSEAPGAARDIIGNEYVPAPPAGYRLVRFRSVYENGVTQTESVSLAWEDGAWKVVGIVIG